MYSWEKVYFKHCDPWPVQPIETSRSASCKMITLHVQPNLSSKYAFLTFSKQRLDLIKKSLKGDWLHRAEKTKVLFLVRLQFYDLLKQQKINKDICAKFKICSWIQIYPNAKYDKVPGFDVLFEMQCWFSKASKIDTYWILGPITS